MKGQLRIAQCAGLVVGTMMLGMVSPALADDSNIWTKAAPQAADWYYYGALETGGRFVIDRPPSGFGTTSASSNGLCPVPTVTGVATTCFLTPAQTQSRAKFEEYGDVLSSPFLDWINLQAGTRDGRFSLDVWARNVGLNNQNYNLTLSRPGQDYFTFEWDQTPHLISTSGKTVFGGVGSTFLTVNPALPGNLASGRPPLLTTAPGDATARANIQALINAAAMPLTLGTQRDRATVGYRATPTPDWDFRAEYSHEDRTGVVPASIGQFFDTASPAAFHYPIGIPKPVDDTTQSVEANGERSGISFLGMRWTTSVVYNGSFYHNNLTELNAQNPFCTPAPGTCDVFGNSSFVAPTMLRLGLDPSNEANAVTWNTAVDIPFWKTRYVSTVQYNDMRQNDPFINTSINGLIAPPVTLNGAPVGSLNGRIDTLLWNNVLTLHPDKYLELILRGRHYAVDNDTPSLHVDDWISLDTQCASGAPVGNTCAGMPRNSLPISYTKDNYSAEAKWTPVRPLTIGGGYFFEHWDRSFRDTNTTNENSGKIFVDAALFSNVQMRGSYLYGVRRYGTYDTNLFVLTPGLVADQFATNLLRFDEANRNRQKADVALEFAVAKSVTITPNFGLLWDDYPAPVINPLGLRSSHSWNAGVEIGAAIDPRIKLMASYNYQDTSLRFAGGNGNIAALTSCPTDLTNAFNPPECTWFGNIDQQTHTFLAAANIKVVPDKLDLRLEALYTRATESSQLTPCAAGPGCDGIDGVDPATVNFGQFPPERVTFQKYSAIGRYYVDPVLVRQMGWIGDVVIKARYSWMRNSTSGFTYDNMTPYWATPDTAPLEGGSRSLFLAAINPNYTAQVVAMSLELKW
jgi:MtrB/PioB family decaheme-associated outer membrane protein